MIELELSEIWEAFVEVEALDSQNVITAGKHAFVIVVFAAASLLSAKGKLQIEIEQLGFRLVKLDYLRTVPRFDQGEACTDLVRELAAACQLEGETQFGPFHTWTK